MTRFTWVARSQDGRTLRGTREAGSEALVLDQLRSGGLLVIQVRPAPVADIARRGIWPSSWLPPRPVDIEVDLRQVAVMLRSGLPLLAALRTCASQSSRRSLARVWLAVQQQVQSGASFSAALAAQPCFPLMVTSLVAVGERTGNLDVVLERASAAMERRRSRRTAIVTALTYPVIVLVLTAATVAFMMVSLIPKLSAFLKSLGRTLPAPTQFLVDLSAFVQLHAVHLGLALLFGVLVLVALWFSPARRSLIDPAILHVPLVSNILRLSATATFAHNLALLLSSGVRITGALAVVEPLLPNHAVRASVGRARERVLQGSGLSEALVEERAPFGPLLTNMIAVGESSGTLDIVLADIAAFHDARLAVLVGRLGTIIEPVIIIVIGGIVGFVYMAFFLAIYSIAGGHG